MKLIIAGGRDHWMSQSDIQELVSSHYPESSLNHSIELVCGMAKGIDESARRWALSRKIKVTEFPANWNLYGKAAGPFRNRKMACYGTHLLAIWDGLSRGTKNMIEAAREQGLEVTIHRVNRFQNAE